ncbi:GyrI-like domain-containing protein [Beijerinckia indica]|nr:GyrI-like domain-containing protein [Beijerinckia indica]
MAVLWAQGPGPVLAETSSPTTEIPAPETPATPPPAADTGTPGNATTQVTTIEIPARPVLLLSGSSDWEKGFATIREKLATIETELKTAGLTQAGHPLAVFTSTDENGFKFSAMIPITAKPEGLDHLGNEVKVGDSPSGKAIKFQHRDAYDTIDSTYDLITAYLDEKGLEAQNLFIEEYLTDTKTSDDTSLETDIYVFLK